MRGLKLLALEAFFEIWPLVSREFREKLCDVVKDLEEKAALTENKWDDIGVSALKVITGCDKER